MSADQRGRAARSPGEIPPRGWRDIALRVGKAMKADRVGFTSAGMAFYFLLGLAPLMVAFVGIYGLLADPGEVADHVQALAGLLPKEVAELLEGELLRVAEAGHAAGVGLFFGIVLAVWSSTKVCDALVVSMNIAYNERERRNYVRRKALSVGLSLGMVLFGIVAVGLLAVLPLVVSLSRIPVEVDSVLAVARWPLLFVASMLWLAIIYRYAPCRENAKWRWISWGAFLATVLWVFASAGFSFYVANFANYSATYGSLGAVIVLLMWCFLTGFCVVLGAEINAEIEHQTARDSTTGAPRPLGDRGAYVADHIGEAQD